jgi:hypothetical protein
MRRGSMIGLVVGLCLWALPVQGRRIGPPAVCCQHGITAGLLALTDKEPVFCKDVVPGPELEACTDSGGTIVAGSCHPDGACGGSTICCEGVSEGQSCSPTVEGGEIAQPESCAEATEDDCDALSAAGEHATDSVVPALCSSVIGPSLPTKCIPRTLPPPP